ncbi:hypothetical protein EX30DRAFT_338118 [Ascodesmis nigricans]|uniref:Uncharacterized protein n=1 Tax=Ascodesmis nigricans TaxID=341454 RepID=A0A4S2N372_9PEZI|nr:hypothetical protein EX30DRAFT_338118 [Ascodesmis nigricans]
MGALPSATAAAAVTHRRSSTAIGAAAGVRVWVGDGGGCGGCGVESSQTGGENGHDDDGGWWWVVASRTTRPGKARQRDRYGKREEASNYKSGVDNKASARGGSQKPGTMEQEKKKGPPVAWDDGGST